MSNNNKQKILSYKIENNNINIELENGTIYAIPYTEENEQRILKEMEETAKEENNEKNQINKSLAFVLRLVLIEFTSLMLTNSIFNILNVVNFLNILSLTTWSLIATIITITTTKRFISNIKNKKEKFFLENKKELNITINRNEDIKNNISKKAKEEIESQTKSNKDPITINNLDNYSLSDLKTLKIILEIDRQFGSTGTVKSKPKRKILRKEDR